MSDPTIATTPLSELARVNLSYPGTNYHAQPRPTVQPDAVNHPAHYTSSPARCDCGQPIECIQIARHWSFNLGNALKYIWRADLKGAAIQDLEKAAWYLADEIKKRKGEA